MKFCEWLKINRQKAGLTQQQLADKLNVSQSMINRYENSDTEPRISFVVEIADVLNSSLDELRKNCYADGSSLMELNALISSYFSLSEQENCFVITVNRKYKCSTGTVKPGETFQIAKFDIDSMFAQIQERTREESNKIRLRIAAEVCATLIDVVVLAQSLSYDAKNDTNTIIDILERLSISRVK